MRDQGQLYFATNKEIHDLLFSAKQKITEAVLHELLRDRGIICSPADARERLVEYLSMLPHDYADVCGILDRRESPRRGEKTSTVTLNVALTPDELKEVIAEYQQDQVKEAVHSFKKSESEVVMAVTYPEYDYSKTRLLQRQDRDAALSFKQKDGKTEIRIPATEKARAIVEQLKGQIEAKKKKVLQSEEITLAELTSHEGKTSFFTKLISSLPKFPLETVSRLRVALASGDGTDADVDLEAETADEITAEMLGVVRNVALAGDNLVASTMYQELKEKGFFITSVTWRSKQSVQPYTIVEFDAGFEDGQAGTKFRYSVRGALRLKGAAYPKFIKPVEEAEKEELLAMIESTARTVLADLLATAGTTSKTPAAFSGGAL